MWTISRRSHQRAIAALVLIAALSSPAAHSQQVCQYIGNIRYCNGVAAPQSTLPVTPMQDYGAMINSIPNAAANQRLMNAQAELANQQADLLRAQQAQIENQRQAQIAADAARADQERQSHDNAHVTQKARYQKMHDRIYADVWGDTTDGLNAKAATLEAVLRNSLPDSDTFQDATQALLIVNGELAKRGKLK